MPARSGDVDQQWCQSLHPPMQGDVRHDDDVSSGHPRRRPSISQRNSATYRRGEEELGIDGAMCRPWAMGNVSMGDRHGLDDVADAYKGYIDNFAEQVVLPMR